MKSNATEKMGTMSNEELLILAVVGGQNVRRAIDTELSRRTTRPGRRISQNVSNEKPDEKFDLDQTDRQDLELLTSA